jgi:hypothetical protein
VRAGEGLAVPKESGFSFCHEPPFLVVPRAPAGGWERQGGPSHFRKEQKKEKRAQLGGTPDPTRWDTGHPLLCVHSSTNSSPLRGHTAVCGIGGAVLCASIKRYVSASCEAMRAVPRSRQSGTKGMTEGLEAHVANQVEGWKAASYFRTNTSELEAS